LDEALDLEYKCGCVNCRLLRVEHAVAKLALNIETLASLRGFRLRRRPSARKGKWVGRGNG